MGLTTFIVGFLVNFVRLALFVWDWSVTMCARFVVGKAFAKALIIGVVVLRRRFDTFHTHILRLQHVYNRRLLRFLRYCIRHYRRRFAKRSQKTGSDTSF